jgi:hypothetical protein
MLRKGFDKPVINLHELTNGLEKYYNQTLNQEVLGKPKGTNWGYYQSLPEIETLLGSADHYKTSRLAHYHIVNRKDSIADQIKFYNYLNENFFIISCRRENLLEHALSWGIQGHSKKLNVYSVEEKINVFNNIYQNKVTISKESLCNYLNKYKYYIDWSNSQFNIQSHWNYDTDVHQIEKYILNLDFMQGENNTWKDMFGQDFATWNTCHRMLPNLHLLNNPSATKQINLPKLDFNENEWNLLKGSDWPDTLEEFVKNDKPLVPVIQNELTEFSRTVNVTEEEFSFLMKNLKTYIDTNTQISKLVDDGFLVSNIPLKLQSLKEKKLIIKNFSDCVLWYNEWVSNNKFGNLYTEDELDILMVNEDQRLSYLIDQQNLLQ